MSPLQRFQVLLTGEQLAALRNIERRTGISVGALIRLAIDQYLNPEGETKERKRASVRKQA
jgi:ribbon-helix-helix protein